MPPKRRNPKSAHPQAPSLPIQSDYETDTNNLTDLASAIEHVPPTRTNTQLNLAVLQRYLPGVEHIVAIAPFAVVYIFSAESQQWEKCGMEGTLFVCQLQGPRYSVMVLNRKSLDNFVMELKDPENVELTPDYVILQDTAEEEGAQIYGLWIFADANETQSTREFVAQAIQECAVRAQMLAMTTEEDDYEQEPLAQTELFDHPTALNVQHQQQQQQQYQQQPQYSTDQTMGQSLGQTLDLSQLFTKPAQVQQATPVYEPFGLQQPYSAPPFFANQPDTKFFHQAPYPPVQQANPVQAAPAQHQQDILLNLFRR